MTATDDLFAAIKEYDEDGLKAAIQAGANINKIKTCTIDEFIKRKLSPVVFAVIQDDPNIVNRLIANGAIVTKNKIKLAITFPRSDQEYTIAHAYIIKSLMIALPSSKENEFCNFLNGIENHHFTSEELNEVKDFAIFLDKNTEKHRALRELLLKNINFLSLTPDLFKQMVDFSLKDFKEIIEVFKIAGNKNFINYVIANPEASLGLSRDEKDSVTLPAEVNSMITSFVASGGSFRLLDIAKTVVLSKIKDDNTKNDEDRILKKILAADKNWKTKAIELELLSKDTALIMYPSRLKPRTDLKAEFVAQNSSQDKTL